VQVYVVTMKNGKPEVSVGKLIGDHESPSRKKVEINGEEMIFPNSVVNTDPHMAHHIADIMRYSGITY